MASPRRWCRGSAPVMVLLLAAVDYVLLLLTSSYGFASVVRACRQSLITGAAATVLLVLHLLFVTDVVAAIILHSKVCKAGCALAFRGGPSRRHEPRRDMMVRSGGWPWHRARWFVGAGRDARVRESLCGTPSIP